MSRAKAGFVLVTAMLAGYAVDGKTYGPFQATPDNPHLEVPEELANALNLPRYEGGTEAQQDGATEPPAGTDAAITDAQAQATLRADLAEVTRERDELREFTKASEAIFLPVAGDGGKEESGLECMQRIVDERNSLKFSLESLQRENDNNVRAMNGIGADNTRMGRILLQLLNALPVSAGLSDLASLGLSELLLSKVEAALPTLPERLAAPAEVDTSGGTPLVDGLPVSDLLTAHGFTSMELLEAGLVVPKGAEESPVQAVNGIGKKSVEAYQKAVTDWRAGLAQAAEQ